MPGIIGAAILIFVPTTGDFVTPELVGGTKGTMIANLIEAQFNGANNWPLGAALSLVSMGIVAVIAGLFVAAARATARAAR
jgi:spermidine/putrescine transport system permease protein